MSLYQHPNPFNLFLSAGDFTSSNNNVSLFLNGTTNSGITDDVPLFIEGQDFYKNIPLMIQGAPSAPLTLGRYLFIEGTTHLAEGNVPLFLNNNITGYFDDLTLFIKGSGLFVGSIPYNRAMNLYINRNDGYDMTLYIAAGTTISSGLTLQLTGGVLSNSGVPLVLPYPSEEIFNSMRLHTIGL